MSVFDAEMNLFGDSQWLFEAPMFSLVNPNDICPLEVLPPQPQPQPPPPTLSSYEEPTKLQLQQKLHLHKVLSKQRQERFRAQLAKEPAKVPLPVIRKMQGRKMTGRERQLELEREEERLLQQKEKYQRQITELESKCNKLRAILEEIVANSPDYNSQMINFLESTEPLLDNCELKPCISQKILTNQNMDQLMNKNGFNM